MAKDLDLTFDFSDMPVDETEAKEEQQIQKENKLEEIDENASVDFSIDVEEEDIALPNDLQEEIFEDVKEDNIEYLGDLTFDEQEKEQNREFNINSIEVEEEWISSNNDEFKEIEEEMPKEKLEEDRDFEINSIEVEEEEINTGESEEVVEEEPIDQELIEDREFNINSIEVDEEEITIEGNKNEIEKEEMVDKLEENKEVNESEVSNDFEEEEIISSNEQEEKIENINEIEEITVEPQIEKQQEETTTYNSYKMLPPEEREEKINQEILDEFEDIEPQEETKEEIVIEEQKNMIEKKSVETVDEDLSNDVNLEISSPIEEDIEMDIGQIAKVELGTKEPVSKKTTKFNKKYIIWIIVLILFGVGGYFLKDKIIPTKTQQQEQTNNQENNNPTVENNENGEEEIDDEEEEAKNKLLLEQKEKMEKAFPFYKVVSLSNMTFLDYLWENFNGVVSEKFEKIIDPQIRESTVFLYQYKPQKLSNKKLINIVKKSVKWDKVAFKIIANIYWKLNKKGKWVDKKLKTEKWVNTLNKILLEQLKTNVPFVTSINKELETIANKSNNRLALFVYKNRIKDLRQTIVETKPSIQEVLSDDDFVYFEKWLSLPETKNYNIKQEQKMTEILLWALLQNERIVSVLKKSPDKIVKELDNSTVLRDAIDLTYKIDFYHKYLSDMLKINLEEN